MMGLLPLLFALLIADTSARTRVPLMELHGHYALAIAMAGSVVAWLAVSEIVARLLARSGARRWLVRWDVSAHGLILVWFAWACYGWGWTAWAGSYTLTLLPWVLMQAIHWWCMTVPVRVVGGHPWSRWGRLVFQFRFSVLPIAIILPCLDLGAWLATWWRIEHWFTGFWGMLAAAYGVQVFILVALVLFPLGLIYLWGARPMPDSDLARLMRRACGVMGVRVAGLMRWPVPGGRIFNAAVVGLVPPLRYVLFTDDLLREMEVRQLMAVLGHELGHARHGHLWLYVLFTNVALLVTILVDPWLAAHLRPWLGPVPKHVEAMSDQDPLAGLCSGLAGLAVMAVLWRLAFGHLSRACERQADLAGAMLAGDGQNMCDALKSVARLSGQPENEPSWRHYSITQRIEFLDRVRQRPELAARHHHLVSLMRNALIIFIVALLAALVSDYYFNPLREAATTAAPAQALAEWVDGDPALGEALLAADRGEAQALSRWITRADDLKRQRLALLHERLIELGAGLDADGDPLGDDRLIYRYRYRLSPFTLLQTGNAMIDLTLDNLQAYGRVAGTDRPTEQDLAVAKVLLPKLEAAVKDRPDAALHDTIGCVHFALGEYALARDDFNQAASALAGDRSLGRKPRAHQAELYRRRLEAATRNAGQPGQPGQPGAVPEPLPKDWAGISNPPTHPPLPSTHGNTP